MVMKLKVHATKLSEDPVLIERINELARQTFKGAPETATLYAAAMRSMIDMLKPRPIDANDAYGRIAKHLEANVRTHAATIKDFMLQEAVDGPVDEALVDANKYRPTVEEVNAAAGMVARNMESRQLGSAEKVVSVLNKMHT